MILAIAIALVLISVGLVSALHFGPRELLMPEKRKPEYYQKKFGFSHPSQIGMNFTPKTLTTADGYKLSYWLLDNPKCEHAKDTIIYLHGITDSKVSGLNYAKAFAGACRKFFLIDMRRHGESGGKYCTYGYYEKHDVVRLIDQIKATDPDTEIVIIGVSMGGAIAIQTAAIDKRVARIVAIAPFYDLFSIALDHELHHIGIRSRSLLKFVLSRAERMAKFRADEVSPATDIRKIEVPILIVHGEHDKTVKVKYSQELAKLSRNAELLMVPGAGHADVLEMGGADYVRKLSEFLKIA